MLPAQVPVSYADAARITPMRAKSVEAMRLHRGLPSFAIVFGLGQLGDVERGMSVYRVGRT